MKGQPSLFDELIIDNFAGGGGASTGIELATGRIVDIAINHDRDAILMHKTNHPFTEHYQESVWNIDPREVCKGRPVGLAWFSPDCKHFSKAKGAALVDRKIRGLAWIVLRWAGTVRPRVIIVENVEEFVTWGPVRKGKPIKKKAGQTFNQWLSQLQALGYDVEYRELVAADYGTPTSRKRFFLIARCDDRPIVWPERTHAPTGSKEVMSGKLKPWRSAAEIIDWSLPCPSIFATSEEIKKQYGIRAVRPLAENTQKRIARGLDKFVIKNTKPFIVPVGYGERAGQAPRVHNIDNPMPTGVSTPKHYLCSPVMTAIGQTGFSEDRSYSVHSPVKTIVSKAEQCIINPIIAPYMATLNHSKAKGYDGYNIKRPHCTITSVRGEVLICPTLIQYHQEQSDYTRGQALERPLMTVDSANRFGVMAPYLTEWYGNAQDALNINKPMHTQTSKDREALTLAYFTKYYGGGYKCDGNRVTDPLSTITSVDHNALCACHIAEFKGQDKGQNADAPLRTITAGDGQFGVIRTYLTKIRPGVYLHNWHKVRQLLNDYCGYNIAEDEILILLIGGTGYFISDIGLRMLVPKELYAAQGCPIDYIIDRDYLGNAYKRTAQVARCGNMVCPPLATALVRANLPEWCTESFSRMSDLMDRIAI